MNVKNFGYIYKTTNMINGKIYIGQHKSNNFDLNYIGSGINIKRAIKKFGAFHTYKKAVYN